MNVKVGREFFEMPFVESCLTTEDGSRFLLASLMVAGLAANDKGFLVDDDLRPLTPEDIESITGIYRDTVMLLLLKMAHLGALESRETEQGFIDRIIFPQASCGGKCKAGTAHHVTDTPVANAAVVLDDLKDDDLLDDDVDVEGNV